MQQLQEERPAARKYEGAFARRNFQKLPYDQSLPAQPIGIRKAQSRKKPTNLCAPREFLKKMCLPCLILIKSCYLSHVGVLHAQRIMDFFILITHKWTMSENRASLSSRPTGILISSFLPTAFCILHPSWIASSVPFVTPWCSSLCLWPNSSQPSLHCRRSCSWRAKSCGGGRGGGRGRNFTLHPLPLPLPLRSFLLATNGFYNPIQTIVLWWIEVSARGSSLDFYLVTSFNLLSFPSEREKKGFIEPVDYQQEVLTISWISQFYNHEQ